MADQDLDRDRLSRRQFVGRTLAGASGVLGGLPLLAGEAKGPPAAAEKVRLGGTKVTVTRLAMGTGSNGGQVQRDLGQEGFTRLIRHGWERGIRFIDTADAYRTHGMVREAIRGLPRDELVIQTKMGWKPLPDVGKELDRFRKELGVEVIDIVLIHNADQKGWPQSLERMRDALGAAKEKGIIRAHGVSVHGLPGLREVAGCKWVEVALLRINHAGRHMDGAKGEWQETSDRPAALEEIRKVHAAGKGVIGMKIIGNGDFQEAGDREKSIQFVLGCPFVDAVDIGFKSPREIDEAIERMDRVLRS